MLGQDLFCSPKAQVNVSSERRTLTVTNEAIIVAGCQNHKHGSCTRAIAIGHPIGKCVMQMKAVANLIFRYPVIDLK